MGITDLELGSTQSELWTEEWEIMTGNTKPMSPCCDITPRPQTLSNANTVPSSDSLPLATAVVGLDSLHPRLSGRLSQRLHGHIIDRPSVSDLTPHPLRLPHLTTLCSGATATELPETLRRPNPPWKGERRSRRRRERLQCHGVRRQFRLSRRRSFGPFVGGQMIKVNGSPRRWPPVKTQNLMTYCSGPYEMPVTWRMHGNCWQLQDSARAHKERR